jgi:hypothetical protein
MDFKTIKNTNHYLYDNKEEYMISFPNSVVRHNWRHGDEGEWVFTDDGFVCQILKKGTLKNDSGKKKTYVRTVCGTFLVERMTREMLGENGIAENIYTLSGTNKSRDNYRNRGDASKELLFARYIATRIVKNEKINPVEAYKNIYPDAKAERYIKRKADSLLKTESINTMIRQEIREKLDEEGVTDNWLIERYKTIADLAESDNAKLRSLDSLAKISGLFDTEQQKSEQVTIWSGFSPEQLEEVKKHGNPEIIAHAEKDENS